MVRVKHVQCSSLRKAAQQEKVGCRGLPKRIFGASQRHLMAYRPSINNNGHLFRTQPHGISIQKGECFRSLRSLT
jgi:hypothetical protein